jgi:hypothetical protein
MTQISNQTQLQVVHGNSKFWVSATEAFRRRTLTEVSSSKILPETSRFELKLRVFVPKLRVFEHKFRGFELKLRVFEPKLRDFSTETLGFPNRNFDFPTRNFVFLKTGVSCF